MSDKARSKAPRPRMAKVLVRVELKAVSAALRWHLRLWNQYGPVWDSAVGWRKRTPAERPENQVQNWRDLDKDCEAMRARLFQVQLIARQEIYRLSTEQSRTPDTDGGST